ncbi:MAG TPA: YncE family protein [Oleiagrimonas sp.]|nr:YncE family protein [Oleiagrimonas sp.]
MNHHFPRALRRRPTVWLLALVLTLCSATALADKPRFDVAHNKLVHGLYQAAYSERNDVLYVTSAVGRPPIRQSQLLKVDPQTLQVLASTTPPTVAEGKPGLYAVYGVDVDDAHGTVWVTNTRQDTVAVYDQDDLSLRKQFAEGTVAHSRDVIVDAKRGKAYASAVSGGYVAVFDTATLKLVKRIPLLPEGADGTFAPASLALNAADGKLYVPDLKTPRVAVIDTASDTVDKLIALPGAESAIGVAWDGAHHRVLVTAQKSHNLLVVDPLSGKVVHDVAVGAGALNVAFDPVSGLAFVSNRKAGTIAVVDPASGERVARLDGGTYPNHVAVDGKGHVFAINKSHGADDPEGDRVMRLTPAS